MSFSDCLGRLHLVQLTLVMVLGWSSMTVSYAEIRFSNDLTTTLTGDMLIPANQGVTRGDNLFHSFDIFNVLRGESATFTGPDTISNVIAKVSGTGGTLIDGLLKSEISQADLFLINPNGIVFGEEAAIDVNGSLYFSTANSLIFADGSKLFVSESGNSVLTSAAPVAFGFIEPEVAPITLENAIISNGDGTGIALIGGDITLRNSSIYIPDGSIDIVSLQDAGEISVLPADRSNADLGELGRIQVQNEASLESAKLSEMILRYGKRVADLDVSGLQGGRIDLLADTLNVTRGFIFADTEEEGQGRGIAIHTRSLLALSEASRITTDSLGDGAAGDIELTSEGILRLSNSSTIASDARGSTGDGGRIHAIVGDLVVESLSQIKTTSNGQGHGGAILIETASVELSSGGSIAGQTIGNGSGGNITISATDAMLFDGSDVDRGIDSGISVSTLGAGNAGVISLVTPVLELKNGASIKAFSGGQSEVAGAAGSITIQSETLVIDAGSRIDASSYSTADAGSIEISGTDIVITGSGAEILSETIGSGKGGSIEISADAVQISNGGGLTVTSSGSGNAGEISISATRIEINNGAIEAGTSGSGKGGAITISADNVAITAGGIVNTGTRGTGDAGTVDVNIGNTLAMSGTGSSISSRSGFGSNGQYGAGGSISIRANAVEIDSNAVVEATSSGTGFAGDLSIYSATNFYLLNSAALRTNAINSGGGNINLEVLNQIILNESTVTASAGGENANDDSGNVTIDPIFLILKHSSILAQANFGDGGAIFLSADNFIPDVNSVIDASSRRGNDGEIIIASPDTEITGVLGVLNTSFFSTQALLREPCAALAFDDKSSLIVVPGQFSSTPPTGYVSYDEHRSSEGNACILR